MRRIVKIVLTSVIVLFFLAFFFVPVTFWFYAGSPGAGVHFPVYRSLGCATVGFGDLYAPNWFGLSIGCQIPVPMPIVPPWSVTRNWTGLLNRENHHEDWTEPNETICIISCCCLERIAWKWRISWNAGIFQTTNHNGLIVRDTFRSLCLTQLQPWKEKPGAVCFLIRRRRIAQSASDTIRLLLQNEEHGRGIKILPDG